MFESAVVTEGHFDVLSDNLSGTRVIDEQTFSSVAVLAERLDKLQRSNSIFQSISFSPEAQELVSCEALSDIC